MWEHPWRVKTEGPRNGTDLDGKCVITYDRSKIKDACAVIFFLYRFRSRKNSMATLQVSVSFLFLPHYYLRLIHKVMSFVF